MTRGQRIDAALVALRQIAQETGAVHRNAALPDVPPPLRIETLERRASRHGDTWIVIARMGRVLGFGWLSILDAWRRANKDRRKRRQIVESRSR